MVITHTDLFAQFKRGRLMPDFSDLTEKYGEKNVEDTCIYILTASHPQSGLAVAIQPTHKRVADVLDAVHREFLD